MGKKMIVAVQGTHDFEDYNVFLRAMAVALSCLPVDDKEFNKIVTEIKNSTLESYRNIIPYLIDMLYDGSRNDKIYAEIYKKYFNKLNE